MRLDVSQQMRLQQQMKLAPRMIQSMEILQLPIMALEERIQQELEENVMLETTPAADETADRAGDEEGAAAETEVAAEETDAEDRDLEELLQATGDLADQFTTTHRVSRGGLDDASQRKHDAMQNMASRPESLHDYLIHQFSFFDTSPVVRQLGEIMIHNLDESGYLTIPLEHLVERAGPQATLALAEEALFLVQKLDPPGIGARDLKECLLLQISPDTPCRDILITLVSSHLKDLEHNRLPLIERKTGHSLDAIKAAWEELKKLDPKPGGGFVAETAPYVVPDVFVEPDEHHGYKVRLQDQYTPHLNINPLYQKLLRSGDTDQKTKKYIQHKLLAAKWLIESIEQRRSTLTLVAQAIVDFQKDFFDKGPEYIEPLKMQQVADRVGRHVTTVSRAVDDKWVQTPRGIFPLKRFFGGGTVTEDGGEVAYDVVQLKLREIVDTEDKSSPYSDEDLAAELHKRGYNKIARRTVTKYRRKMGIPDSRRRKEY